MGLVSWIVGLSALAEIADDRPRFDGYILAAADADMVAFAYADGRLEPLSPDEGVDSLILITEREGELVILDQRPAPNSVISWPQIVEGVAETRSVYVVETRGALPRSVEQVESAYTGFPEGRSLFAYHIEDSQLTDRGHSAVGLNPQSVSRGPDANWLLIASEDDQAEAVFVEISDNGTTLAQRTINLDPDYREGGENRLRGLFWSPDGTFVAANVENKRVEIYRVERDTAGDPSGLIGMGEPLEIGGRWSVGKWTPDGQYFLLTDTGWPDESGGLAMLTQPRGRLVSISVTDRGEAFVADEIRVGLSPEGFDISPDGRLAVTVNMGRTYLPDIPLLRFWPGRNQSSLTLVSLDPDTGALSQEGPEIYFDGVLPEDAIFDEDGDSIAVATFHLRTGTLRRHGLIDLWRVMDTPRGPRLQNTGERLQTVRGPHDLVLMPEP